MREQGSRNRSGGGTAAIDPAGAATLQHSRISAPAWRDASTALVRGGVLQVQATGTSHASVLPHVGGPPSKLLKSSPPEAPAKVDATSLLKRSTLVRSRSPEVVLRLRERVERTNRLPDSLKEECLQRLDSVAKKIPPEAIRRPSWIHDKDDRPAFSPHRRGHKVAQGSKGSSSRAGSSSSERSGGERSGIDTGRVREAGSGDFGGIANLMVGGAAGTKRNLPAPRRREKKPQPEPRDYWTVGGNEADDSVTKKPGFVRQVGASGGYPSLSPTASAIWRCTSKTVRSTPSWARGSSTSASELPHHSQEVPDGRQALRSTKSVPSLSQGMPSPRRALEARLAVAAARDALALPPDWSAESGSLEKSLPVRGMGSLLRTSMRYALQT